jgi:hypothetical protein
MNDVFFIVYPGGDKTRLSVASLTQCCLYEKGDYAVASRKEFYNELEASDYCKILANNNNLIFDGDSNGNIYLD